MYIKIYFDEKPVYLCDELNKELKDILHHPDTIFIDELSGPAIKSLIHEINKHSFHTGVFLHGNLDDLKNAFFKHFTQITAAGGIVQNDKGELLFIYRLNKWDLPKGKVEPGEDLQTCAVREVEEETGVTGLTITRKAGETYHSYNAFGKHFIKTSHWYGMNCASTQNIIPQTEEDITEVKWVNIKNISAQLDNTYPSIKDILAGFFYFKMDRI